MKKFLLIMTLGVSFLFSATLDLQTASKNELMCIKGIGQKKAEAIIRYRKSNKLKSADDLLKIQGFGKVLVERVKRGETKGKCRTKNRVTNKAEKGSKKTSKSISKVEDNKTKNGINFTKKDKK